MFSGIISLSFNSFAEVRKSYYESGVIHTEGNFKNNKTEGLGKLKTASPQCL
jgi:antitoxin component YwqK of YwqJK toxin-antitoxin module